MFEKLKHFAAKVTDFVRSHISRDTLLFVSFFLLAGLFWLALTLNEVTETELKFPIELENVPTGVVITNELPEELTVKVSDQGTELIYYLFNNGRRKVVLDYSAFNTDAIHGQCVVSEEMMQQALQQILSASTQILSIQPDTIDFYYSRSTAHKRVPVRLRGNITTDPLYYLESVQFSPDSVTVWADKALLDTLEYVYTSFVNHTDIDSECEFETTLAKINGAKIVPGKVKVKANVDVYMEQKVEVPVHAINFPGNIILRTFPTKATISYHVGMKHYKEIDPEKFVLAVTYEDIMQLQDSVLTLHLRSVPDYVSHVEINPQTVQYILESIAEPDDEATDQE